MRPKNIINAFATFIFVTAVATAMTADPAGARPPAAEHLTDRVELGAGA